MATELAVGYVSLVPSARGIALGLNRQLTGPAAKAGTAASKSFASSFGSGIKKFGAAAGVGLGLVGVAVAKMGLSFVEAAEESRKVTNQTNAVIKSTGAAANVSAAGVGRLTTQLMRKTGIDDEVIGSGANVLLTFTRVRNEVGKGNDIFNQATAVTTDLSVALGKDMSSSAILVGKALNDPVKGMSALSRAGVQFTEQQREQITAMVESGDQLGAQKIILAELQTQFGGSAAAQATASEKLKVAFGEVAEQIGGVLLPYVDQFSTWMLEEGIPLIEAKLIPKIKELAEWIANDLAPAIRDEWLPAAMEIGAVIRDTVLPLIDKLGDGFLGMGGNAQTALVGAGIAARLFGTRLVTGVAGAFTGIIKSGRGVVGFFRAGGGFDGVRLRFMAVGDAARTVGSKVATGATAVGRGAARMASSFATMAVNATRATARVVAQIALQVARWVFLGVQSLLHAAKVAAAWLISMGPIGLVIAAVAGAAVLIVTHWETIRDFVTSAARAVVGFLQRNWPLILAILTGPIGLAVLAIVRNWDRIKSLFSTGIAFVKRVWSAGWNAVMDRLRSAWTSISTFFTELPGKIRGFFSRAIEWLVEGGKNILRGAFNGIKAIWTSISDWLGGRRQAIRDKFAKAIDWLLLAGKNVIRGLLKGFRAIWSDIVDWFKDVPGKILDALGIASPPRWAINAGKFILEGIIKGLGLGVGSALSFMAGLAGKFTGPLKGAWDGLFDLFDGDGGSVSGLVGHARRAFSLFGSLYPGMTIGGWRATGSVPGSDHPKGKALDLMTSSNSIAQAIISVFKDLAGAKYWIWNRRIATKAGGWRGTHYGGPSPHTDHVHLSFFKRGAWDTGSRAGLGMFHPHEMVLPEQLANAARSLPGGPGGVGAGGVYVAPGAVVIAVPPGASLAEAERLGGAGAKGFLDVLARRSVLLDARIA